MVKKRSKDRLTSHSIEYERTDPLDCESFHDYMSVGANVRDNSKEVPDSHSVEVVKLSLSISMQPSINESHCASDMAGSAFNFGDVNSSQNESSINI